MRALAATSSRAIANGLQKDIAPWRLGGAIYLQYALWLQESHLVEINGIAHIILRASRFGDCVAFYDALMPLLGLEAVFRSDGYVYYVGGRTALGIRRPEADLVGHAHEELAPGIDHLCFRARSREDVDELYPFIQQLGAEIVRAPEEGPWAPGYYSVSFRDPEGIRLEVNYVPGKGVLAEGAAFNPAPEHPLAGPREASSRGPRP